MVSSPGSRFVIDCLSIIFIDLLLAGDNALVIAMAVRALPPRQRRTGIIVGAASAVLLRIILTIVATELLGMQWIKLLGGAFVIWIAVKVLADTASPPAESSAPGHLLRAIWLIAAADITMSADNVLAVAGASRGSVPLIVLGLGMSIPLVMFSSNLLVVLMDRYPWTVYLGAALLGKVGAEMMITDPFILKRLHPSQASFYAAESLAMAGILAAGRILAELPKRRPGPV